MLPENRLMTISVRLQSFVQIPEVLLQVPPIFLLRYPVHAYRGILSESMVRTSQCLYIDMMGKG
jgi:hypothetical protein